MTDTYDGDYGHEDLVIDVYEIIASPNDFNIRTIYDFISSGTVKIPPFQRNYVWDINRASKLVESIIMGLPIPQLFLYQQARNEFLVIDGQQRLMSIYYFIERRFPRKERRIELRTIFDREGHIPENILHDDQYFSDFNLRLPGDVPGRKGRFHLLNYSTLGEYKTTFDLRTIRNIIIRQTSPEDDDSCIYELFNRLNTQGVNLKPQEIRTSLYESEFYRMLYQLNLEVHWRAFLGSLNPDLYRKDVEILLRGFAMLVNGDAYKPSMLKFLNTFSKQCKALPPAKVAYMKQLFLSFLTSCQRLSRTAFFSRTDRFNISAFESVFRAVCLAPYRAGSLVDTEIDPDLMEGLKLNPDFVRATQSSIASAANVRKRLDLAEAMLVTHGYGT